MDHSEVKHLPKVDHTPAELDAGSQCLLRGAARIETCGLWKEGGSRHDLSLCALLSLAGQGAWEAEQRLKAALGVNSLEGIFKWNDAPERTKDEVVAKLRAVALSA